MGTSTSSIGPGSGVSFDPPWLNDIDLPNNPQPLKNRPDELPLPDRVIAPKARFGNARRNMRDYATTGSKDSLRRSLGHYSKTGMGGAKNVANRLRISTKVAANLFNSLRELREGNNQSIGSIINELKSGGADAYQFIDAIIESICPDGGSLDEISPRNSGYAALSDFFQKAPNADISNLSDDDLWSLTTSFLGYETFSRIQLDIGQVFERQDIPVQDRVIRLNEMRDYITSEISSQVNQYRQENQELFNLQSVLENTIKNTFEVFEGEV